MESMDPTLQLVLGQLQDGQKQIGSDVSAIRGDMSTVTTKLAILETRVSEHWLTDIESRLRVLERFRFLLMGMAILASLGAGFLGSVIQHLVK